MQNKNKKSFNRRYIIPAAVLLLLTAAMVFILLTQEESKPDPTSERIIREAAGKQLNKDPNSLTDEDFAKITNFAILDKELSDIKLLEKFTSLQTLQLSGIDYPANKIPKWMSLMAKLGLFNLEERFAMDLSPIENLTNLQMLYITNTKVSDIKPLANLTNLQKLRISKTDVSDITPLANLPNLSWLVMSDTQVSDISALANLTSLRLLYMSNMKVSDIKPLANLTKLQTLTLSSTNVSDEQVEELQKALPNLTINR